MPSLSLQGTRVDYDPGSSFENPNSGHTVGMAVAVVYAPYSSKIAQDSGTEVGWSSDYEETRKLFHVPTWQWLVPQAMFHNG